LLPADQQKSEDLPLAEAIENLPASDLVEPVDPAEEPFRLSSFYISRFQLWDGHKKWHPLTRSFELELQTKCNGMFIQ
jgi:hypothetical protein